VLNQKITLQEGFDYLYSLRCVQRIVELFALMVSPVEPMSLQQVDGSDEHGNVVVEHRLLSSLDDSKVPNFQDFVPWKFDDIAKAYRLCGGNQVLTYQTMINFVKVFSKGGVDISLSKDKKKRIYECSLQEVRSKYRNALPVVFVTFCSQVVSAFSRSQGVLTDRYKELKDENGQWEMNPGFTVTVIPHGDDQSLSANVFRGDANAGANGMWKMMGRMHPAIVLMMGSLNWGYGVRK
jgi:hypothetical protein